MWPQPDCFKPFTGDNGGATATGVTADTIKVVVWLAQPEDPVLKFIYAQIGNNDTPDQTFETFEGFAEIFNTYYETYGRKVELIRYNATGPINDSTAATADAETIARDIKPFFVINGPLLTKRVRRHARPQPDRLHRVHAGPARSVVRRPVALRVGRHPQRRPGDPGDRGVHRQAPRGSARRVRVTSRCTPRSGCSGSSTWSARTRPRSWRTASPGSSARSTT